MNVGKSHGSRVGAVISLCLATLCVLGLSCIPVEDLGEYWDKGVLDPHLEGHWKEVGVKYRSQDRYVSFEKAGTSYRMIRTQADLPEWPGRQRELGTPTRSLIVGKHRFLMVRFQFKMPTSGPSSAPATTQPAAEDRPFPPGLIRYAFENGQLVTYTIEEQALAEAIRSGRIRGRVPRPQAATDDEIEIDCPAITKLDEKTVRALAALADDPRNWKVTKYGRVHDLAKALETSRTYPATQGTARNTRVHLQLADLKYFAEGKEDVLLRQLQVSPEWMVCRDRNDLVAYRRALLNGRWKMNLNGYQSSFDLPGFQEGSWQIRCMFRFSKDAGGPFARLHYLTKADPLAGDVQLKLKSSDQGIESYLAVGKGSLWFEYFEQSFSEPRVRTAEALKWLAGFLSDLRKSEDEVRRRGYAARLLPRGSVRKGKPSIEVKDGFQGGMYDVGAWANTGGAGDVYLKVFDAKTGARLSADRVADASQERMGWSKDPRTLFFYNRGVTVYEGDWEHFYDARFELWFRDEKTAREVKLVETTRRICGWQR